MSKGIRTRYRIHILVRDHQRCRYCGKELDPFAPQRYRNALTIDHVVPISRGGTNHYNNLVVSCWPCNRRKGDLLLEEAVMRLLPVPGGRVERDTYREVGARSSATAVPTVHGSASDRGLRDLPDSKGRVPVDLWGGDLRSFRLVRKPLDT